MIDGGPVYRETNIHNFIVEPFNFVSALLFIVLSIYWFQKIKYRFKEYGFLSLCILILFLGAIGGSLYHGFRNSVIFMYLDWFPILLLCILASLRFSYSLTRSVTKTTLYIGIPLLSQIIFFNSFENKWMINLNYIAFALLVISPTILLLIKHKYFQLRWVVMSVIFFVIAIFFRVADKWFDIPMGTHFLWHIFGLLTAHSMLRFIYKLHQKRII